MHHGKSAGFNLNGMDTHCRASREHSGCCESTLVLWEHSVYGRSILAVEMGLDWR